MSQSPRCSLVVIGEGGEGQRFPLVETTLSIGRSSVNDICLDWDRRVSRTHARLSRRDETWMLEDLGSTNGTFVELSRIDVPTPLANGSRIRAGRVWLQMMMDQPVPRTSAPAAADVAEHTGITPEAEAFEPLSIPRAAATAAMGEAVEHQSATILTPSPEPEARRPALRGLLTWLFGSWWQTGDADATPAAELPELAPARRGITVPPPPPPAAFPSAVAELPAVSDPAAGGADAEGPWLVGVPDALAPIVLAQEAPGVVERVAEPALSVKVAALQLEIRALASDPHQATDTEALRSMLNELELPPHLEAQMQETLGSADVFISLVAPPGAQGELLVFAGQVVARLSDMPAYREVLVTPHNEG